MARYVRKYADSNTIESRLWGKVDKSGTCWLWYGAKAGNGYGVIFVGGKRKQEYTHRVSWQLANGEIPDGMFVLHQCDVPACINPAHLFLGSISDNNWDKVLKGREPKGESHKNSKLTEARVRAIRNFAAWYTQRELAPMFGVQFQTICKIVNRRSWKHVQ